MRGTISGQEALLDIDAFAPTSLLQLLSMGVPLTTLSVLWSRRHSVATYQSMQVHMRR